MSVVEVLVVDPVTGGAKGSKAEDYSQVPPLPLALTINYALRHDDDPLDSPYDHLALALSAGAPVEFLAAAASAVLGMGGLKPGLDAVARVYRNGGVKYAPGNWALGYSWRLSIAAAWRHLVKAESRCSLDDGPGGDGEPHWAHFVFHMFALYEFARLGRGTDDQLFLEHRYGRPA